MILSLLLLTFFLSQPSPYALATLVRDLSLVNTFVVVNAILHALKAANTISKMYFFFIKKVTRLSLKPKDQTVFFVAIMACLGETEAVLFDVMVAGENGSYSTA